MEETWTRRGLLGALAAGASGLAGCGSPSADPPASTTATTRDGSTRGPTGTDAGTGTNGTNTGASGTTPAALPERVRGERVAEGFTSPVDVAFAAGETYVADQPGRIWRVADGTPSSFLDLRDRVVDLGSGYSERGLLGMAFHPDFPDDDRVFVRYSAPPRSGTPSGYSHTFVLASVTASPASADPGSERSVLEIPEPQSNHNGGSVTFGPDGHLYAGVGDGGGGGDRGRGHVADWYEAVPGGNGQDVAANLLGSILRLDVDAGDRGEYGIPDDNPLVGASGLDEQYAWGFRNPWRFSFDGDAFYVADVGQNRYEEVDSVVAGGNYGWNVREGPACYGADSCPRETPDGEPLRDPVVAYPHDGGAVSGLAVVGGYVARGDRVPGLAGRYVFADWQSDGRLFVATPGGDDWPVSAVPLAGSPGPYVLSFGRDPAGDLYVCTSERSGVSGNTGALHRIVPA